MKGCIVHCSAHLATGKLTMLVVVASRSRPKPPLLTSMSHLPVQATYSADMTFSSADILSANLSS